MRHILRWTGAAALASFGLLGSAGEAQAQFGYGMNPYNRFTPGMGLPYGGGYAPSPFLPSTYGANPYNLRALYAQGVANNVMNNVSYPHWLSGNYPYLQAYSIPYGGLGMSAPSYDPYAGYGRGSTATAAPNDPNRKPIDPKLALEQAKQEKLKTKKMMFEQWLDAQKLTAPEAVRTRQLEQEVQRSLNSPSVTEVASGKPINDLIAPLSAFIDQDGGKSKPASLDPLMVKKLNVTRGDGFGNPGVLKDGGRLTFPAALTVLMPVADTRAELKDLESYVRTAYDGAVAGGAADLTLIKQIEELSKGLNERLTKSIKEFEFKEYNAAKDYLKSLDDAVKLLRQPDAAKWINGDNAARGTSVQELVKHLSSKGVKVAPANPGDEQAYLTVHRALVSLYVALRPSDT